MFIGSEAGGFRDGTGISQGALAAQAAKESSEGLFTGHIGAHRAEPGRHPKECRAAE